MSRVRKATGAAVGAFLATFPTVSFIEGSDVTDPRGVLTAAAVAAGAAFFTYLAPPNTA